MAIQLGNRGGKGYPPGRCDKLQLVRRLKCQCARSKNKGPSVYSCKEEDRVLRDYLRLARIITAKDPDGGVKL